MPLHVLCSTMSEDRKGMEFAEELFDMLVEIDHEALTTADSSGKLPLHLLCEAGFFSNFSILILEKMLHAAEETLMSTDIDGRLPLHLLCESKLHTQLTCDAYRRLVRGQKEDKSNLAAMRTHEGSLPLHSLCGAGHHSTFSLEIFRALVEAYPASVGVFDSSGQNAIHRLCGASGHTDHTEEIFNDLNSAVEKMGKNGAELQTLQGWLPVHIICGAGHHTSNTYRIFQKLLKLFRSGCLVASSKEKQASWRNFSPCSSGMVALCLRRLDYDMPKRLEANTWTMMMMQLPIHVLCEAPNHTSVSTELQSSWCLYHGLSV
jgi:hypothetical protein